MSSSGLPLKIPPPHFVIKIKFSVQEPDVLRPTTPAAARAKKYTEAIIVKAPPQSSTMIPTEERIWWYVPCQMYATKESFPFSSEVVNILRHCPNLWEDDGATSWNVLVGFCSEAFPETKTWTSKDWLSSPEQGATKVRFEYCLDNNDDVQYMRAIQGHSGGERIDPKLQNDLLFLRMERFIVSGRMRIRLHIHLWQRSYRRRNRIEKGRTTDLVLHNS